MALATLERRGAVAILTLNNPEKQNALTNALLAELKAGLDEASDDPAVRALVLTGAGKGFCSGADLGSDVFSAGERVGEWMRSTVSPLYAKFRETRLPIISAINGAAAGAGFGLAMCGDVAIAARSARFILSFVRLGATLDGGATVFLQRAIGAPRTRALALLGEALPAETALAWGLIYKVVEDADLMNEAMAVAERLASGPPLAIAAIKRQLETSWNFSLREALDAEAGAQARSFESEDLREGARAFIERRPPRFTGR